MSILLTIVAVIVIFSLLVLIHEYGHFFAARRAGIKVLEFGVGFPPRLFSKKIGETIYSINAIPFGGFVKLFGEDATSPEILKNKRSFASMSPWVRTKVVVAGVFMNFVLAVALLTIGFSFGIEPLLVTEEDLFTNLAAGSVKIAPGIYIGKIDDERQTQGLAVGDRILAIDDKPITNDSSIGIFTKGKAEKDVDLTVIPVKGGPAKKIHIPLDSKKHSYGLRLKGHTNFPRLVIAEVRPDSESAAAGLKPDDVILRMNAEEIYFPADFENVLAESSRVTYEILRGHETLKIPVTLPDKKRVVVADIFENTPAQKAGLKKGDIIVSINGAVIREPQDLQETVRKNPEKEMEYRFFRDGKEEALKIRAGKDNLIGIAISTIASYRNTEISVFRSSVLTSIIEIKKVRYNPVLAFRNAFSESFRLTGLTINAFGKTIGSLFSKLSVPADIGGPVQIAVYTHAFVKEGFFALLRFAALLSLSLAVLNILPIPALDGGRLLFIIIEVVFKKRVSARIESLVHGIGFVLLLLLIVLVTYSDITKLF